MYNPLVLQSYYIHINKMSRLVLLFMCCIAINALNYQERGLYYDERDNVCRYPGSPEIIMKINVDGLRIQTHPGQGGTWCRDNPRTFKNSIMPAEKWIGGGDFFSTYHIEFAEETRYVYVRGSLQGIIQKTTVTNPSTFDNKPYNCQIIGDGSVKHFGENIPGYEPCVYYIKCDQIVSEK